MTRDNNQDKSKAGTRHDERAIVLDLVKDKPRLAGRGGAEERRP